MIKLEPIKGINGTYTGRQLVGDEAQKWKRYKATFKVNNAGTEQDWNFSYFTSYVGEGLPFAWINKNKSPKKGFAPDNLEEGKKYNIGYTEYQSAEMTNPAKTVMSFQEPKEGQDSPAPAAQTAVPNASVNTAFNLDMGTATLMTATYFKLQKPEAQNENHYLGTIVRSMLGKNPQVIALLALYKTKRENAAPINTEEIVM